MRHRSFGDFVDKQKRESIRQLRLVKSLLEKNGLRAENFLEDDEEHHDPYVFCHSTSKEAGFDGIRIYKIGDDLAFRVQKETKTHPYGSAYPLPIESMFHDFMSDEGVDEKKAGQKIIEAVGREVRRFFEKSAEAEKKHREREQDRGDVSMRTGGTDYSSLVYSKG